MAHLKANPTLKDLQQFESEVCRERGWTEDSAPEKFLLFVEEVGELAKAMRNRAGLYEEPAKASPSSLEEELADVLSYVLDLANCYDVDLEKAFRDKESLNQTREWK